jgi:FKBP-type peptidyl-prolyl cis-trans isomerase
MTRITCGASALLACAMGLAAGAADAAPQKVFRCGPDGRIYSQTPCKDGYEVNAADPRSAEQRKAAEDATKREDKVVDKAARERQAQEAAAAKQGPSIIPGATAASPSAPAASGAAAKKRRAGNGQAAPAAKPAQP